MGCVFHDHAEGSGGDAIDFLERGEQSLAVRRV